MGPLGYDGPGSNGPYLEGPGHQGPPWALMGLSLSGRVLMGPKRNFESPGYLPHEKDTAQRTYTPTRALYSESVSSGRITFSNKIRDKATSADAQARVRMCAQIPSANKSRDTYEQSNVW